MPTIDHLHGLEILDSRGRPTVQASCELSSGATASASVPSGASTGAAEAVELRDGDPGRYRGLGCRRAVENIATVVQESLVGREFEGQRQLDEALLTLDGTPDKSRLGANAILAVSLAYARAAAQEMGLPLYRYFAALLGQDLRFLPRPTINLFSGGKHAGGQVPIQDLLLVPLSPQSFTEALAMTFEIYQTAAERVERRYGMRLLTADEGGLAPPFAGVEAMFENALEAIDAAGFTAGREVALAVDVAASHFYWDGSYHLDDETLDGAAMVGRLQRWCESYPILSVEDGLAEEDWESWRDLTDRLGEKVVLLGDDLLCTDAARIRHARTAGAANALLLKVNQVGTLTEAAESYRLARAAAWKVVASARSGETEDNWLADLAVGWRGDAVKIGSITQSERLAKYNRLLAIEAETGLPLAPFP